MSTVYTPTAVIMPGTITLPQDLVDQRTAASVNVPFQTLADAITYLMTVQTTVRSVRISRAVVGVTAATAKSGTQVGPYDEIPSTATPLLNFFTGYTWFADVNAGSASTRHVCISIDDVLVSGLTLDKVYLYLKGKAGHGALPTTMPALSVVRYTKTTNTIEELNSTGIKDDLSANVGAYEAYHSIYYECDQNHTVDLELYTYSAIITNEANTNALNQLTLYSLETTQAVPRYRT